MTGRRLTLILLLSAAMAACSNTSGPLHAAVASLSASPSPAAAATSTAGPTPVAMTIAQARQRYVGLVRPLNALRLRWNAAAKAGELSRQRALANEYDTMLRSFDAALLTTAWPPSVADTAHKLAEANATDLAVLRPFEVVRTQSALTAATEAYNSDPNYQAVATQVELMRTLLGLPKAS